MADTTFFLRDDDIGVGDEALPDFIELFRSRGIPVSYQVIPARLDASLAEWLRGVAGDNPSLIELGQHGHTHQMLVGGETRFHEFGPERDKAAQAETIRAGRALMDLHLGDRWNRRLFTPPQHRFNRDTLEALAAEGFSILSASSYSGFRHRLAYRLGRGLGLTTLGRSGISHHGRVRPEAPLLELSIAVAVDAGRPVERSLEGLMDEIAIARRHQAQVGLMLHHHAWKRPGGMEFLARFADRLLSLPGVRFATLGAIADELVPG
jgi:predicted deacetylase